MIIVDSALKKREADKNPIKVAMIGAGFIDIENLPVWFAN